MSSSASGHEADLAAIVNARDDAAPARRRSNAGTAPRAGDGRIADPDAGAPALSASNADTEPPTAGGLIAEGQAADGHVANGASLLRFAQAITTGSPDVAPARAALLEAVGPAAFIEAACTVAVFAALVRAADASGIPLDENTRIRSAEARELLGLNSFLGAANG